MDEHRKLHVCGNNPSCSGYESRARQHFKDKRLRWAFARMWINALRLQLKTGRFGKYFDYQ